MRIRRDIYLDRLIRREQNGLVKIVTGVRRCGKSYLLFDIFHDYLLEKGTDEDHIIEVALDDRANIDLRDPDKILSHIRGRIKDREVYYVILDEIQMLPDFEDVLSSLMHMRNVDVYVTGSNSHLLSSDVVTAFRGRGDEIRIHPLSFREFSSAYEGEPDEAWDDYFTYGGLPLILSRKTTEDKAGYLSSLLQKVYLSDIVDRHRVRNRSELDELVDILASSVGSLTNPLKLSNTFRSVKKKSVSDKTIKRYIDYLEDAFLVSRAARYDIKGKRYINSPSKFYFEDVGLRNVRLNFRQMEENHIMENILYNDLRIRGYSVDVGIVEAFEKDGERTVRKQLEVDFIASLGSDKYYIQSAFAMPTAEKRRQAERPLSAIGDSFRKIIVVHDNIRPRRDENGIVTVGVRHFLLGRELP